MSAVQTIVKCTELQFVATITAVQSASACDCVNVACFLMSSTGTCDNTSYAHALNAACANAFTRTIELHTNVSAVSTYLASKGTCGFVCAAACTTHKLRCAHYCHCCCYCQ
eukprot:12627-Heterococcus_DN1.PRE.2